MTEKINDLKIAIYTLGCKVNQYESDCMADAFRAEGCRIVDYSDDADVYIVNTCAVTNMAERKSRQIIHRAKKINANAVVVACGCYVQAAEDKLKKDLGIDLLVGNNRKKDIVKLVKSHLYDASVKGDVPDINAPDCEYENMYMVKPTEHVRAYVKVQDGCNNFCSYCIIPYTRGRIRSRAYEDVIAEITGLASNGIKEVVLTGINLSSYQDGEKTLTDLLIGVADVEGICRVRMGSLEPRVITEDFLGRISKNSKICPHFHLSLQSACNETLKRMNRKYTIEEYIDKCNLIRQYYDRPAITTDVIVGFPGETEDEFDTTKMNLDKLNLYEMHIFKYSIREGTVAATMPNQIPDLVKEERSNVLLQLAKDNKVKFEAQFQNEELQVLFEEYEEHDDHCIIKGHTDRYILVRYEASKAYCSSHINVIDKVKYTI